MLLSSVSSDDISVAMAEDDSALTGATIPHAGLLSRFAATVCKATIGSGAGGQREMLPQILPGVVEPALVEAAAASSALGAVLGPVGFADAAAVVAMFNGINRVADMCGVIIDQFSAEIAPSVLDALQMEPGSNWGGVDSPATESSPPSPKLSKL